MNTYLTIEELLAQGYDMGDLKFYSNFSISDGELIHRMLERDEIPHLVTSAPRGSATLLSLYFSPKAWPKKSLLETLLEGDERGNDYTGVMIDP